MWRFPTNTGSVPVTELNASDEPWQISSDTSAAFKVLAEQSCAILKGRGRFNVVIRRTFFLQVERSSRPRVSCCAF